VGDQYHAPAAFTPVKDPAPIVQEVELTPGPVWTCEKNLVPTGIRSPDRPNRSQSLYLLRCPAHNISISTGNVVNEVPCNCFRVYPI
jgi:hypothetical protein